MRAESRDVAVKLAPQGHVVALSQVGVRPQASGMLYESWIHRVTIVLGIPSAAVGALLALRLVGMEISFVAMISILLLIGIVKKNAIMMIDFAIAARRDEGLDAPSAIRKACLLRFRPLMMTTLCATTGALPIALGVGGAGAELRQPLGVAVVGGHADVATHHLAHHSRLVRLLRPTRGWERDPRVAPAVTAEVPR